MSSVLVPKIGSSLGHSTISSSFCPHMIPSLMASLSGVLLRSGRYISPGGVGSSVSLSELFTGSSPCAVTGLPPSFRFCTCHRYR